eukprot:Hpha_TRINITY_DN10551_c1_g4::TRINITY_DN10551_c1_g4_i2::g.31346::m.31346
MLVVFVPSLSSSDEEVYSDGDSGQGLGWDAEGEEEVYPDDDDQYIEEQGEEVAQDPESNLVCLRLAHSTSDAPGGGKCWRLAPDADTIVIANSFGEGFQVLALADLMNKLRLGESVWLGGDPSLRPLLKAVRLRARAECAHDCALFCGTEEVLEQSNALQECLSALPFRPCWLWTPEDVVVDVDSFETQLLALEEELEELFPGTERWMEARQRKVIPPGWGLTGDDEKEEEEEEGGE